ELGVAPPPGGEATEATKLLHHLIGAVAVARFHELSNCVEEFRSRTDLAALDRLVRAPAPGLFRRRGFRDTHRPSDPPFLPALPPGQAPGLRGSLPVGSAGPAPSGGLRGAMRAADPPAHRRIARRGGAGAGAGRAPWLR